MTANVGTVDRVIRGLVGVLLILMVFVGPQTPWGWIGIIPLVTAIVGFCPAYKIFGLSTCPTAKS